MCCGTAVRELAIRSSNHCKLKDGALRSSIVVQQYAARHGLRTVLRLGGATTVLMGLGDGSGVAEAMAVVASGCNRKGDDRAELKRCKCRTDM